LHDEVTTRAGNDVVTLAGGRDFVDLGASGAGGDRLILDWTAAGEGYTLYDLTLGATGYSGNIHDYYNSANRVDFVGVDRFQFKFGDGGDNATTGDGADTLIGGGGGDYLGGGGGDDKLFGQDQNDNLVGAAGIDRLAGGLGADTLSGGTDGDIFAFATLAESWAADGVDLITDLENDVDRIDLRKVDADTTVNGDQKFKLTSAFTHHARELVLTYDSGTDRTLIQGDVDGDGVADLSILVAGDHHDFTRFLL
jgi:Ca2+-binding RTX toxin-like protein